MRDKLGPGYCGDRRPGPMNDRTHRRSYTRAAIAWDGNRRRGHSPAIARRHAFIGILVGLVAVVMVSTAFALSIKGTPVGGETQANNHIASDQANPSIASDASGNFVVVWQSDGQDGSGFGVYARMFDTTGSPKGSEFIVNSNVTGDQCLPDVSYDGSGSYIVTWQSWGDHWDGAEYATYGIYKREFDGSGVPATPGDLIVNIVGVCVESGVSGIGRCYSTAKIISACLVRMPKRITGICKIDTNLMPRDIKAIQLQ